MNALIYDPSRTLAALTKAFLLARDHRVSISISEHDARQKLGTALFDILFLCTPSAPLILAEALRTEFSHVAVLHIGSPKSIQTQYPVYAQLCTPFSPLGFNRVMEKIESELPTEENTFDIPVDLVAGSDRLLCRATRASSSAFLLEGLPESFTPFLEIHGDKEFRASWRNGEKKVEVSAELIFEETIAGRWAALRCREGSPKTLLTQNSN